MALDGVLLSFIAAEINSRLENARVDRVLQPERDELDIVFRMRKGSVRLLISASSNNPRLHFTQNPKENPASPPMFCMLLRKHLSSARFTGAEQSGFERILFLNFDCYNEFGDQVKKRLAVEIMGKHSNIILIDENGRITEAIKHIDDTMSSKREVLPGIRYELPPQQDKLNPVVAQPEEIMQRVLAIGAGELQKALLTVLQGVSPIVCRELAKQACRDTTIRTKELLPEQKERLIFFLKRFSQDIKENKGLPQLVMDAKTGKPIDFSFLDITQYGTAASVKRYDDFSQLLDAYYTERDRIERVSQRGHDFLNVITNAVERISRKIDNQLLELKACDGREQLRIIGDLISSNIHNLKRGQSHCELENYYEEDLPKLAILLDPMLSPQQNSQKYFKEYRKAFVAEKFLKEQIEAGERELKYLETVFDELSRASGENELLEIREELVQEGYLKNRAGTRRQGRMVKESPPHRFLSSDGFEILVGRNNRQNDKLTLKIAAKNDIWLHTRNIPGAHVIIRAGALKVPNSTVTQAAILAALHSHAGKSAQVPVDYTFVKNVKKPSGAKPGMVIYEDFKTAFVSPDSELSESLKQKNK